ncbi:hypothetical protein [Brevibacillus brevis]|uniref:hypothetical protein n=1 Tax=Brevibacillus brevis TaxID=1393 RepID=UPI000D103232|nr:hypothetical protein [Brevibacillus brevis]PSJ65020.1 hypothetical protein C7J99_29665 [Brevibacillus brevis]
MSQVRGFFHLQEKRFGRFRFSGIEEDDLSLKPSSLPGADSRKGGLIFARFHKTGQKIPEIRKKCKRYHLLANSLGTINGYG